jgi:hypothetical protein
LNITPESAIARLTRPWTDVIPPDDTRNAYTPVDHPAMLDMLNDLCRSSYGAGASGASSDPAARSLLNLEAVQLREHIDGTVRAWHLELSKSRAPSNVKDALTSLAGILNAHHAANSIQSTEYDRIMRFFPRWCGQIWRLYDPPTVKELAGACPNPDCEQERYDDGAGNTGAALVAWATRGTGEVKARCRVCGWEWDDPAQLALLGRHLGATQDEEVLRAAGIA